ncbi:hypothetical protein [Pannonibacter indicus]|uniref:Uncharacterized protein n=1 Tax=Pannonibacter indicus TaxID=466044 RepID=A0A0K6HVF2_9HYPH|nr:hypothetical protein [Pannonibacter indicus]CUA94753.1 hypothetical protein Ga0061067_103296 [Pannonibacter indicus]
MRFKFSLASSRTVSLGGLRGVVSAVMLGALAAGCVTNSYGEQEAVDKVAVRKIMEGIGAVDPQAKPIEYKPRAPLAMPAKLDQLPQPEKPVTETAANWPAKEDKSLQEVRAVYAQPGRGSDGELLTPEQMRGVQITGAQRQAKTAADVRDDEIMDGARMTPAEMKKQSQGPLTRVDTSDLFGPDGKPVRRYLVEPPIAYSTPAGNAPLAMPNDRQQIQDRKQAEMDGARIKPNCTPTPKESCLF